MVVVVVVVVVIIVVVVVCVFVSLFVRLSVRLLPCLPISEQSLADSLWRSDKIAYAMYSLSKSLCAVCVFAHLLACLL